MLKLLQKHARALSILLLIALLAAFFFAPASAQILSITIIIFGIGTAVIFTIHTNRELKTNNDLTNPAFLRNTLLDLLGLALVMGLAMYFGRLAGGYAGQSWGLLAGIIVAMAAGFGTAFLVGRGWEKVTEPLEGL